jgi:riboflavin kinase/FMN adenylyltransferase
MRKKIFALGFFDGVHLGHQALLTQCIRLAREKDAKPAAITFDRHPQALFSKDPPALINTVEDRQQLLRRYGMEEIHVLPVNRDIMSTDWQVFLENLLAMGAVGFVCGNDFRFGHGGQGNAETLARFCRDKGLPCSIIPEQTVAGSRVSSTRIRKFLESGDMEQAIRFLGHPHVLTGPVIAGRQLGRTIGVPTANVWLPQELLVPALGVYVCQVRTSTGVYPAVTNVGNRPTVQGHHTTVEAWLLDFEGDLYGQTVTVEFYKFLRPEQKYPDLAALQAQIALDAAQARAFFREREK